MAVIANVLIRGISPAQYDSLRAEVGWLEKAPTGGHLHLTWWQGNDCHNIDVWESEAAFGAFAQERMGPAMAKLGINAQPEATFQPAYEVFVPKAVTLT